MTRRPANIVALTLVMLMANLGVAHANLLLCQNSCDYALQTEADTPPCCRSKQHNSHAQIQTVDRELPFADCPHVNSGKKVYDTFSFLTGSSRLPSPAHHPPFLGLVPNPTASLQVAAQSGYHTRSGLSPPGIAESPPPYLLNCAFLI